MGILVIGLDYNLSATRSDTNQWFVYIMTCVMFSHYIHWLVNFFFRHTTWFFRWSNFSWNRKQIGKGGLGKFGWRSGLLGCFDRHRVSPSPVVFSDRIWRRATGTSPAYILQKHRRQMRWWPVRTVRWWRTRRQRGRSWCTEDRAYRAEMSSEWQG